MTAECHRNYSAAIFFLGRSFQKLAIVRRGIERDSATVAIRGGGGREMTGVVTKGWGVVGDQERLGVL